MMTHCRREKNINRISITISAAGGNFWDFWERFYTKNITAGEIARRRREIFEVSQEFLRSEMHFS